MIDATAAASAASVRGAGLALCGAGRQARSEPSAFRIYRWDGSGMLTHSAMCLAGRLSGRLVSDEVVVQFFHGVTVDAFDPLLGHEGGE